MKFSLQITKKAKKDLLCLDRNIQKRIADKIRFFIASDNPLKYAKKLRDFQFGTYRFRIGEYQIIFDIDQTGEITILVILRIKHRKEVYL